MVRKSEKNDLIIVSQTDKEKYMAAVKEMEWDKLMEMWTKTPFELYKTGRKTLMKSMGVNGAKAGSDPWASLMEGMSYAGPWKAFMEGMLDSASSGDFTRDMGMFSVEAFNRAFETATRNAMFKRVGPARNFQVKIDESMEKMSEFNVAGLEFFRYLSLPVISATRTMLQEMTRQGNKALTADGAKEIYSRWLAEMEVQYAALFKTPAYIKALDYFVQASSDSRAAMLSMYNDIYRQMGIASLEEMDGITLELYQLKKKVDAFEKNYGHAPGVAA